MTWGDERGTSWIEIDLAALRANYRIALQHLPEDVPVLAVVKANAYGHGAVGISRVLLEEGASVLGVATVREARELREAGIEGRILILGRMVESQIPQALRWHAEVTVHHGRMAEALSATAVRKGVRVPAHLKVDTGMTRLGFYWETAFDEISAIWDLPGLDIKCVYTHFANADLADRELTRLQIARFEDLRGKLEGTGIETCYHMANSAAILTGQAPEGCGARPGLMLYGSSPSDTIDPDGLQPILTWKSRVIQVKEVPAGTGISYGHDFVTRSPSRIATVAVGYADGYLRSLTNRGQMLIGGRRVPVVGRVTMDMTMVDVTGMDDVREGDEAVIIGRQGGALVTAEEVAAWAGTINYEVYCALSHRVPRYYLDGQE